MYNRIAKRKPERTDCFVERIVGNIRKISAVYRRREAVYAAVLVVWNTHIPIHAIRRTTWRRRIMVHQCLPPVKIGFSIDFSLGTRTYLRTAETAVVQHCIDDKCSTELLL